MGGDGCTFGVYEGRPPSGGSGTLGCTPHRVDGGKGRVHPDGIHDPLLLPYTQEPLALQAQGNCFGTSFVSLAR